MKLIKKQSLKEDKKMYSIDLEKFDARKIKEFFSILMQDGHRAMTYDTKTKEINLTPF